MTRLFLSSLRTKLLILVSIAVAPLFALTIYISFVERERVRIESLQKAVNAATVMSSALEEFIANTEHALFFVSQMLEGHEHQPSAITYILKRIHPHLPELMGFIVADSEGTVIGSSHAKVSPLNISDRPHFGRIIETKGFVVGTYTISGITGRPVLPMGLPAQDPGGAVTRVICAGIDLLRLHEFFNLTLLPKGAVFTVLDDGGTVLFRYPLQESLLGKAMPEQAVLQNILERKKDVVELAGPDGRSHYYGFASSGRHESKVFVSVGIPKHLVLAETNRTTYHHLLGLVSIMVIAMIFAWYGGDALILRTMNSITNTVERVKKGDLSTRVGGPYPKGELGELAETFDQMLDGLSAREAEKKQAEGVLSESEKRYRILIETSPDAIVLTDFSDRILMVNRQAVSLFNFSDPEEMKGLHTGDLVAPSDRSSLAGQWERTKGSDHMRVSMEHVLQKKDGVVFPAEVNTALTGSGAGLPSVIAIVRDMTDHKDREDKIKRAMDRLRALHEIDLAITGSRDLRLTLKVILEQVTSQLTIDAALILLLDRHSLALEYASGCGFKTTALQHTKLRMGEGHAGLAAIERRIISSNLPDDRGFLARSPLLEKERFRTYYAVPLIAKGHVLGVLEIFHRSLMPDNQEWLDFLEALATQTAIALDDAALFNDLERSNIELLLAYDTTLEGWSRALDLRDRETEGHSKRVTDMTLEIAKALNISNDALAHTRRGALLHDIGKMGVPDSILLKPGPLNDREWEIMRRHPVYAYELLRPIGFLTPALSIPYNHHEKWDGSGYPRCLKGEVIPLDARIFAIIDVWDALTSDRPYRKAWQRGVALAFIQDQSGKHFDPKVVEVFLRHLSERGVNGG